jgi:AcrR family transcriptional regulator
VPRQKKTTAKKSDTTRAHILAAALALFRRRGFDGTSMRDIASAAGLSLGAAYYYFPSKESIVLHYYDRLQRESAAVEAERLAAARSLKARLRVPFATKLEAVRRDEKILVALTRTVADPSSPLSLFSKDTHGARTHAIESFARAVEPELALLPAESRKLAATALWSVYLALLLYYFHDRSPKKKRTDELVDQVIDLIAAVLPFIGTPIGAPALAALGNVALHAGLLE